MRNGKEVSETGAAVNSRLLLRTENDGEETGREKNGMD